MKKIFATIFLLFAAFSLVSCDLGDIIGGGDEEDDTTVYHTDLIIEGVPEELIAANNYKIQAITYTDENDDEGLTPLAPVYGYVDTLYQNRVDLTAPHIPGYKFLGWHTDVDENLVGLGDADFSDGYYYWWNQYQRNGKLYAKYQLNTYAIAYGLFDDGQSNNPANDITRYCSVTDGDFILQDPTTTNPHEHFVEWFYYEAGKEIAITKLPVDYYEDTLVVFAKFEKDTYNIDFNYVLYVDSDNPAIPLQRADVINTISIKGNLTTIDEQPTIDETTTSESKGLIVGENSIITVTHGSWLELYFDVKPSYKLWKLQINNKEPEVYYDSYGYFDISGADFSDDSTITLIFSNATE